LLGNLARRVVSGNLLRVPVALVTYDAFAMGRRAAELLLGAPGQ
jgi:hypothetical protein